MKRAALTRWAALVPAIALAVVAVLGAACAKPSPPAPSETTGTSASGAASGAVEVGKPAPDFTVTAHDGTEVKLAALRGKHVVLYFYPADETPGCTKEACAFRDAWDNLAKKDVVLVGVSGDSLESHKKFADHHKLPFHLVADGKGELAKKFGVPFTAGFAGRQTIVIGPDGNVKKIYRNVNVTKHADEILADVG